MNRIRRTGTAPVGSGNTAGFAVEDSTGYLVVDGASDNNRPHRRKAVIPVDSAVAFNVFNTRQRITIANVNAGATLLPAIKGFKYRLISATAISVGGAAGAVTTVDILGTASAASRKLVAYAQASLTQSAVLKDGGTGAAVLADGASYTANDVNTAITIGKTGSNVTTATHIDVNIQYALEAA